MKSPAFAISTLFLAAGCADGPYSAPAWASIVVPDAITLGSSDAYLEQDNTGSLIIADVAVVDEETGEPMNGIEVEVLTSWSGVYLLPEAAIKMVDYPAAPDGVSSWEDVSNLCDTDQDGYIDADAEDWCSWYWDLETGSFYQFGSDYADAEDYRPTYLISGTDNRGLLRFYVYVDSLPYEAGGEETASFGSANIYASIRVSSDSFEVGVD